MLTLRCYKVPLLACGILVSYLGLSIFSLFSSEYAFLFLKKKKKHQSGEKLPSPTPPPPPPQALSESTDLLRELSCAHLHSRWACN